MNEPVYKTIEKATPSGITLFCQTSHGGYDPLHWHEAIELLFPLNGESSICINGRSFQLFKKQLLVVDSGQIHSVHHKSDAASCMVVHVAKEKLQYFIPEIHLYRLQCIPELIPDELFSEYLQVCMMTAELMRLYIEDPTAGKMESDGLIIQIIARLIRYFSVREAPQVPDTDLTSMDRIRQVISYVEEHYAEPIPLAAAAELVGLGKEPFCRFFKKSMGISFLTYLNEIRLTHVYQELTLTDAPISQVMEQNGLTNQKHFNRTFKELYGCTPSDIRRQQKHRPDET